MVHEGGIPTYIALDLAAQAQGFRNQAHYWAWAYSMQSKTTQIFPSLAIGSLRQSPKIRP